MESGQVVDSSGNWHYDNLPNVKLDFNGRLTWKTDADFVDETKRSHFDQFFKWRLDEDAEEFVIRISRKPEAPSRGHINVDMKIEGGLSPQPDGSVLFDGGIGLGTGPQVSKFALSFEISHESRPAESSYSEWTTDSESEELEQPEEHEIKFFHHPEHKLLLAPENYYLEAATGGDVSKYFTCDACTKPITDRNARWVYECPNKPHCDYCVHAKCAQLATTIRHPSHLKHRLKLRKHDTAQSRVCDVCKERIPSGGLHYNCTKCDFDLHPECPDPVEEEAPARRGGEDKLKEEEVVTLAMMQMQLLKQRMYYQMELSMAQQYVPNFENIKNSI